MVIRVKVMNLGRKGWVLRWTDPATGKPRQKGTPATNRREAERRAGQLATELDEGRYQEPARASWEEFRERYEGEKLASMAINTRETATTALNHVDALMKPDRLAVITAEWLSQFQAKLRGKGLKETSIATNLRHLRAALRWAQGIGWLPSVPKIDMPKRTRGGGFMRGRPITQEEFERMLEATHNVRPTDAVHWQRFLHGLWLSGLRLGEALILSWEEDAGIHVDLAGRRPQFRIWAEAEKGNRDRRVPMTPDFAEFLLATPPDQRAGVVFKLDGLLTGKPIGEKRVGKLVSKIGERAGVVVNKAEGKFASAHDLRRAFGTRWAVRTVPAVLQQLMRHRSIETTLRYYVALNADLLADELWQKHLPNGQQTAYSQAAISVSGDRVGDQTGDLQRATDQRAAKSQS